MFSTVGRACLEGRSPSLLGKDEVASSNLASSSMKKPETPTSFRLASFLRYMVPTPKTDTETDTARFFYVKSRYNRLSNTLPPETSFRISGGNQIDNAALIRSMPKSVECFSFRKIHSGYSAPNTEHSSHCIGSLDSRNGECHIHEL